MTELNDAELRDLIAKFRENPGERRDWDFAKEALMAQTILELRKLYNRLTLSL